MRSTASVRSAVCCAVVLSVLVGGARPVSADDKDLDAIEAVIRKMVAVVNGPAFARATREKRTEMLKSFYRPDDNVEKDKQAYFFGAFPEPAVGVDKYLGETTVGFDWIFKNGGRYAMQVDNLQISSGGGLGVAVTTTTFTISNKDGKTISANKRRATIVFENVGGRWLISHEHLSAVNAQTAQWSQEKLEKELAKRP
jgi:ketosteroid isomerase-like protein